jgi:hypothetical protein
MRTVTTVLVAALLLAACGPAATPEPTAIPTRTATRAPTVTPGKTATRTRPTNTRRPTNTASKVPTKAPTRALATATRPAPTATTAVVVQPTSTTVSPAENCDRQSYPDVCIPTYPPDLDCGDIPHRRFTVRPPDPHGFDSDNDGVGCESG